MKNPIKHVHCTAALFAIAALGVSAINSIHHAATRHHITMGHGDTLDGETGHTNPPPRSKLYVNSRGHYRVDYSSVYFPTRQDAVDAAWKQLDEEKETLEGGWRVVP